MKRINIPRIGDRSLLLARSGRRTVVPVLTRAGNRSMTYLERAWADTRWIRGRFVNCPRNNRRLDPFLILHLMMLAGRRIETTIGPLAWFDQARGLTSLLLLHGVLP